MDDELKIVLVEDRVADAELIERALHRGGVRFTAKRVDQEAGFLRALREFSPDLVLSDLSLPAFSGTEALRLLQEEDLDVPLIFVSGTVGDEKAVDLLKLGAADYVIKDNLVRLVPAVERTLKGVRLERERRASEEKYREIFDRGVVGIFRATRERRYLTVNPAFAAIHGYDSPEEMIAVIDDIANQLAVQPEEVMECFAVLDRVGILQDFQAEHYRRDGTRLWLSLDIRVVKDREGRPQYYEGFAQDITRRKLAEAALDAAHARLIEASRYAGMAEVATNVLHNVGNVLNSVNVSASLLSERLRNSALPGLTRVAALLREHERDLATFVSEPERAEQLVAFVDQLSRTLEEERVATVTEVESLRKNIEHINTIVSMQQHYTTVLGVIETVKPLEMMEDALRMNAAGLLRHGVEVAREYAEVPTLFVDRHKVLQILVNLISNAKYALDGIENDRLLTLRIAAVRPGFVSLGVMDNGIGIPPENLTRIFEHGFSTRQGGHGFGLHSSALAAHELGGSVVAVSDGPGRGATFTLELPIHEPTSGDEL